MLQQMIKFFGYETYEIEPGKLALRKTSTAEPHRIIVDNKDEQLRGLFLEAVRWEILENNYPKT